MWKNRTIIILLISTIIGCTKCSSTYPLEPTWTTEMKETEVDSDRKSVLFKTLAVMNRKFNMKKGHRNAYVSSTDEDGSTSEDSSDVQK